MSVDKVNFFLCRWLSVLFIIGIMNMWWASWATMLESLCLSCSLHCTNIPKIIGTSKSRTVLSFYDVQTVYIDLNIASNFSYIGQFTVLFIMRWSSLWRWIKSCLTSAHKSINKKDNGIFNDEVFSTVSQHNLEKDLRAAFRNLFQTLPCHKNMSLDFESNVHFFFLLEFWYLI